MGNNLNRYIAKADALAVEAEAIRNACAILAKYDNDNEADAPPTPPKAPTIAPETVAEFAHDIAMPTIETDAPLIADKRTGKADKAILTALDGSWKSAKGIHEVVGDIVTRPAVYQRMPILVARHPDLIEQHATKKEWRAKSPTKAPADADKALPTLPAILTGKPGKVAATVAANDVGPVEPKRPSVRSRDRTFEVFRTPAATFKPLLDYRPEWFQGRGFDPSAGDGRMIREIIERGNAGPHFLNEVREEEREVLTAIPGATVTIGDYLAMTDPPKSDFTLTNPPFSHARAMVEKALTHTDGPVCILQTVQWQSTRKRSEWLRYSGLAHILNITRRPRWEVGEGIEPPKLLWDFAWYVFLPGFEGCPTTDWIDLPEMAA